MAGFDIRELMNDIEEAPGKVWFWDLERAVIDADRCVQCGVCVAACPTDSIGVGEDDLPKLVKMCTGCSASCAQPQIGDIGFRGETAKKGDAIVEGVDVGLGGSLGKDAAFIDWVEGSKPADEVPDALLHVFERFKEERRDGERFHEWVRRTHNEDLRETLQGLAPATNGSG